MPYFVGRGNVAQTWRVPNGSLSQPAISFTSAPTSGLYYASGNIVVCINGQNAVSFGSGGFTTQGTIAASSFSGNGANLTNISSVVPSVSISNIQITDSSFNILDDTAVANTGGYFLVNGSGFSSPLDVIVGASTIPSSVTIVNSNQLRVTLGASPNGTVPLTVSSAGFTTFKSLALSVSPFPVWQTAATLSNVAKTVEFTQSLVASDGTGSNVTYTLDTGSSLPGGVTLYSNGTLTGNIVTDSGNTSVYNFTIMATDAEYQNIPRSFGLTAVPPYVTATGGNVTTSSGYTYHTFTTSGTFVLTSNPLNKTFDVLMVAGGGSGGTIGGGGAGGVLLVRGITVSTGSYSITIGGGGNNSVFNTYTAIAGGTGGAAGVGSAGGSGGGGGATSAGGFAGGAGTTGQGNAGGYGGYHNGMYRCGGGGGGAGAVGGNTIQYDRGASGSGGDGRGVWGSYYGGGGGGSTNSAGAAGYPGGGGLGGGGGGVGLSTPSPTAGTANTGGGGGGGGDYAGAAGGSGIIILRYIPQPTETMYLTGAILYLDASNTASYPGSGTAWYDVQGLSTAVGSNMTFTATDPKYFSYNGTTSYQTLTLTNTSGAWAHSVSFWMQLNISQASIPELATVFFAGTQTTSSSSAFAITSGVSYYYFYNNETTFSYSYTQNTWYHVCLTYSGGNANTTNKQVYINGVNVAQSQASGGTTPLNISANASMNLGRQPDNSRYFPGKLSEFIVHNGALTAAQALQNFTAKRSYYGV